MASSDNSNITLETSDNNPITMTTSDSNIVTMETTDLMNITSAPAPPSYEEPLYLCFIWTVITWGIIMCAVYVVGFVGNILCFTTWTKIGCSKGYNSSIILTSVLAISDMIALVPMMFSGILTMILDNSYARTHVYFIKHYAHTFIYGRVQNIGSCGTIWCTTLITIHRFAVLTKPFSGITRKITSVQSTVIQLVCITVVITAYNMPLFFERKIIEAIDLNGNLANVAIPTELLLNDTYRSYSSISYIVLFQLGPQLLCIALTVKILQLLRNAKSNRKNMASANQKNPDKEAAISVTLVTVVIMYIVCHIPNSILIVLINIGYDKIYCGEPLYYYYFFVYIFVLINSSANIFIYLRCSTEFRNTLRTLFACKPASSKKPENSSATIATGLSQVPDDKNKTNLADRESKEEASRMENAV